MSRALQLLLVLGLILFASAAPGEVCDVDADGDIDRLDLGLIFDARNQRPSGAGDPRDEDANDYITVLDGRACAVRCASSQCAESLEVSIQSPINGAILGTPAIEVAGTVSSPTARVVVNNETATVTATSYVATGVGLTEGENTLLAQANDNRGVIATASQTVTLDTVPPELTVISPADRSTFAEPVVQIVATVTDSSPVTCSANEILLPVDGGSVTGSVTLVSGVNVVELTCTDAAGNQARRSLTLYLDTDPLLVTAVDPPDGATGVSTGVEVTASFSRTIDPASVTSSAFYLDIGGSILGATASVAGDGLSATLTPNEPLPAGTSVDVNLTTGIADPIGVPLSFPVETQFTTEGVSAQAATLFGEVFDDTRGLPLEGAAVEILSAVDGSVLTTGVTDDRGRYLLEPGSANVLVRASVPGFTEVTRGVIASSGRLAEMFDARLTPLAEPQLIEDVFGGEIEDGAGNILRVAPGALGADGEIGVTPISGQGARVHYPPGWTPLSIVQIDAPASFDPPATLTLVDSSGSALGRDGVIVQIIDGRWIVRSVVPIDGSTVDFPTDQGGQYALLVADADTDGPDPVAVGEELTAGVPIALDPTVTATGEVNPPVGRSDDPTPAAATVQIEATTTLRSGTVIKGEFMELYSLRDGDQIVPFDMTQDLVAYRHPDVTEDSRLGVRFPITPSRQFPLTELLEGSVTVRFDADAATAGGDRVLVGASGGGVQISGGSRVIVPAGALASDTPITLSRFDASPVSLQDSALEFLGGLKLDLSGVEASESLSLSLGGSAGLVPTGSSVVIAELRAVKDVQRLVLVALGRIDGADLTSVSSLDGVELPGIHGDGRYLFLRFDGALDLVTGIARDEAGRRDGHLVEIEGLSIVSVTDAAGAFVLVSPPGPFSLLATAAAVGDQVRVEGETGTPLPEILIVATPPRVEAIAVRLPKVEGIYAGPLALLGSPAPVVDDDAEGESSGNGNGLIEAGERIELTLAVRNDGTLAIGKGTFVLQVDGVDGPITVDAPTIAVETIPPDVPFDVGPFVFSVPAGTDPSLLDYRLLHATDSGLFSAIPFRVPMEVEHPDVPIRSELVVRFSEPVVQASLEGAMTLAREEGADTVPVESYIVVSNDGRTATLRPLDPLADSTIYQLSLTADIVDADGRALAGAPIVQRLRTEDLTPPPAIDPGQIEASVPDEDGLVTVTGTAGSVNPDDAVILLNQTTGYTAFATVYADGSFTVSVLADVSDQLTLIVRDRNGNELWIDPGPLVRRDPATGEILSVVIGRNGGQVTSADGVLLNIPAGALSGATELSVMQVEDAFELPADLAVKQDIVSAFEAMFQVANRIRIEADTGSFRDSVKLSLPAPPDAAVGDLYLVVRSRQVTIGGALADLDQLTGIPEAENPSRTADRLEVVETATVKEEDGVLVLSTDSPPFPGIKGPGVLTFLKVSEPLTFFAGSVTTDTSAPVSGVVVSALPGALATAPFVAFSDRDGQFVVPDSQVGGPFEIDAVVSSRLDVVDDSRGRVIVMRGDVRGVVGLPAPPQTVIAHIGDPFVLPAKLPSAIIEILGDLEPPVVDITLEGVSLADGLTRVGDAVTLTLSAFDNDAVEVVSLEIGFGNGFEAVPLSPDGRFTFAPELDGLVGIRIQARDGAGNTTVLEERVRAVAADAGAPLVPGSLAGAPVVVNPPEEEVPFDGNVCVQFSEPIASSTITDQTFRLLDPEGVPVPVTFAFEANGSHVCAQPTRNLRLGASYSLELSSSIEDSQGENLAIVTLGFATPAPALVFEKELANVEDVALAGDTVVAISRRDGVSPGDDGTLHTWRLQIDEDGLFREAESAEVSVVGRPASLAVDGSKAYVGNQYLGSVATQTPLPLYYNPLVDDFSPDIRDTCVSFPGTYSPWGYEWVDTVCSGYVFVDKSWPSPFSNLQLFDLSDPADPKGLGLVAANNVGPLWNPNTLPHRVEVTNGRVAMLHFDDNIELYTTYPGYEPFRIDTGPELLGVVGWIRDINGQSTGRCDGGPRDDQICLYDPLIGYYDQSYEGVICHGSPCNEKPRFLDAVFFDDFAVSLDSDGLRFLTTHLDDLNLRFNTALGSKIQTIAFVEAEELGGLRGATTLGAVPNFDWEGGTDLLFVASYDSGLTIMDVSNPAAPLTLGNLPGAAGTMSFDECRGVAYLHGPHGRFHVVDFNDPTTPIELNDPGADGDPFALDDSLGRGSFNGNTSQNGFVHLVGQDGVGTVQVRRCTSFGRDPEQTSSETDSLAVVDTGCSSWTYKFTDRPACKGVTGTINGLSPDAAEDAVFPVDDEVVVVPDVLGATGVQVDVTVLQDGIEIAGGTVFEGEEFRFLPTEPGEVTVNFTYTDPVTGTTFQDSKTIIVIEVRLLLAEIDLGTGEFTGELIEVEGMTATNPRPRIELDPITTASVSVSPEGLTTVELSGTVWDPLADLTPDRAKITEVSISRAGEDGEVIVPVVDVGDQETLVRPFAFKGRFSETYEFTGFAGDNEITVRATNVIGETTTDSVIVRLSREGGEAHVSPLVGFHGIALNLVMSKALDPNTVDEIRVFLGDRELDDADPVLRETADNSYRFSGEVPGLGRTDIVLEDASSLDPSALDALAIRFTTESGAFFDEGVPMVETGTATLHFVFDFLLQRDDLAAVIPERMEFTFAGDLREDSNDIVTLRVGTDDPMSLIETAPDSRIFQGEEAVLGHVDVQVLALNPFHPDRIDGMALVFNASSLDDQERILALQEPLDHGDGMSFVRPPTWPVLALSGAGFRGLGFGFSYEHYGPFVLDSVEDVNDETFRQSFQPYLVDLVGPESVLTRLSSSGWSVEFAEGSFPIVEKLIAEDRRFFLMAYDKPAIFSLLHHNDEGRPDSTAANPEAFEQVQDANTGAVLLEVERAKLTVGAIKVEDLKWNQHYRIYVNDGDFRFRDGLPLVDVVEPEVVFDSTQSPLQIVSNPIVYEQGSNLLLKLQEVQLLGDNPPSGSWYVHVELSIRGLERTSDVQRFINSTDGTPQTLFFSISMPPGLLHDRTGEIRIVSTFVPQNGGARYLPSSVVARTEFFGVFGKPLGRISLTEKKFNYDSHATETETRVSPGESSIPVVTTLRLRYAIELALSHPGFRSTNRTSLTELVKALTRVTDPNAAVTLQVGGTLKEVQAYFSGKAEWNPFYYIGLDDRAVFQALDGLVFNNPPQDILNRKDLWGDHGGISCLSQGFLVASLLDLLGVDEEKEVITVVADIDNDGFDEFDWVPVPPRGESVVIDLPDYPFKAIKEDRNNRGRYAMLQYLGNQWEGTLKVANHFWPMGPWESGPLDCEAEVIKYVTDGVSDPLHYSLRANGDLYPVVSVDNAGAERSFYLPYSGQCP